jgi:hypothetical protein
VALCNNDVSGSRINLFCPVQTGPMQPRAAASRENDLFIEFDFPYLASGADARRKLALRHASSARQAQRRARVCLH